MYAKAKIENRMTDESIVKLIELYEESECLWNSHCKNYRSKLSRNAAYWSVAKRMAIPGFGPREVIQKMKELRLAYEEEAKRIEESGKNSEVYRPKVLWFTLVDAFFKRILKNKRCSCRSREDEELNTRVVPTASNERKFVSRTSSIRKEAEEERDDEDEVNSYETFGRYVAEALGKMPFECAISAESEIHDTIIKYKIYAMRKASYSSMNALPTSSSTPLYNDSRSSSVVNDQTTGVDAAAAASTVSSTFL